MNKLLKDKAVINGQKVRGVPVGECIGFVMSTIQRMPVSPFIPVEEPWALMDPEDVFQEGFVQLLKAGKVYKKGMGAKFFTYAYKRVLKNTLDKYQKEKRGVSFSYYTMRGCQSLIKKYGDSENKYFNRTINMVDTEALLRDGVISLKTKERLDCYLNYKFKYGVGERDNVEHSTPRDQCGEDFVVEEFIDSVRNLDKVNDIEKAIFLEYHGLGGCPKKTPQQLAKKYKYPVYSIYRIKDEVRKRLLKDGDWVKSNFGTGTLSRLRRKERLSC